MISHGSTIILLPFLAAFLLFVLRFYSKEGAHRKISPSFLLAMFSVAIVALFLFLGITHRMPEYGYIAFTVGGFALLILSVVRIFQM